jgi:hypothetical protein
MKVAHRCCALALGLALAGLTFPAVAVAAPGHAAKAARIRVIGIERDGDKTAVAATIYGTTYIPIFTSGNAVSVPLGTAWIGAAILTTGPGDTIASTTLVMRRVDIRHSETIDLDARAGKLVRFGVDVPGAADTGDSVQACVGGDFVSGPGVGAGGAGGTVYAVPVRTSDLTFGYASTWQGASASYLIGGQSSGGIPRRLLYRERPSQMARLNISFRSGDVVGGYDNADLQSSDSCGLSGSLAVPGQGASAALSDSEYVSAGSWIAEANGYRASWQSTHRLRAGHRYAITFGAAAWGPYQDFPNVQGHQLVFFPMSPISDPNQTSNTCCDISTIRLSAGGRLLKKAVLSQWHALRAFAVPITGTRWYSMRISAQRRVPGMKVPADVLSPRDSLIWRFRATSNTGTFFVLVPVTATRFVPEGLNLQNQAQASARTVVQVQVVEPRAAGFISPPQYAVRTVRVEVSFNDGKTWHAVTVAGHGTAWKATVKDPGSGYVSLRSTVTDSAGDSTTETIYQAYAITS